MVEREKRGRKVGKRYDVPHNSASPKRTMCHVRHRVIFAVLSRPFLYLLSQEATGPERYKFYAAYRCVARGTPKRVNNSSSRPKSQTNKNPPITGQSHGIVKVCSKPHFLL